MTQVQVESPKKIERVIKPKLEVIQPSHVVEVVRMLKRSIDENPWPYPCTKNETTQNMMSQVFHYISGPSFYGLMIRVGKKNVGQVIGQVEHRRFGTPHEFFFIWNLWVEPEYRKRGLMKILIGELFSNLKKSNINHWEAEAFPGLTKTLTEYKGYETKILSQRVGGKSEF